MRIVAALVNPSGHGALGLVTRVVTSSLRVTLDEERVDVMDAAVVFVEPDQGGDVMV